MIPFTTVNDKFKLKLNQNFVDTLCELLASAKYAHAHAGHKRLVLDELKKTYLPLIGLKDMLAGLSAGDNVVGKFPLEKGEFLTFSHTETPPCEGGCGYSMLKACFNQYETNGLDRVAWTYIAEDAERKFGFLFVERERQREGHGVESAIYEFWSFIYVKVPGRITHYAHHYDHFEISKELRNNLVFEGLRKTEELVKECGRNPSKLLIFNIANGFSRIINDLYKFFRGISEQGADKTGQRPRPEG